MAVHRLGNDCSLRHRSADRRARLGHLNVDCRLTLVCSHLAADALLQGTHARLTPLADIPGEDQADASIHARPADRGFPADKIEVIELFS
jgi:hypothetical protein